MSCCASVKQQEQTATVSGGVNNGLLSDLKTLSSDVFEGRKTGTAGAQKAREFITERFNKLRLESFSTEQHFLQVFDFTDKSGDTISGTNIIGYIPGKMKETIVVSAHYDHLGIIDGEIYNGADDNASGVAALLHFAEYFTHHKPNFTIIFIAFDAEEMGLRGAKAFVENPPTSLNNIHLNINMDMIAHNEKGELYASGTYHYPELKEYIKPNDSPQLKILFGHDNPREGSNDWTNQSDHGAFHTNNIPFIYFGVEDHKDYHQPTDIYDNINEEFYTHAVAAILTIIKNIDEKLSSKVQIQKNKISSLVK
ncbi:M20/M25/M40 family metallo-hydrolase [Olivibacter sp. SDN3]|uniref:M20/M25/M40 family metallo-hydrolase n=1 Tax=Olivibacter sp. SDN3 TaxID=2764720 RepID=UPI0021067ABE|nr:M20/M25/M40 family metallo-hydrolase [Olivibacter sp. SDN3]